MHVVHTTSQTLEQYDPRVKVIPLSGFDWSTYTTLEAQGILDDVVKTDWEEGGTCLFEPSFLLV